MSYKARKKQLTAEEWKYFFNLYRQDYFRFLKEYFNDRNNQKTAEKIRFFRLKLRKYIYNNLNDEIIMSKQEKQKRKTKVLVDLKNK